MEHSLELVELLARSSRTFAPTIHLLAQPLRHEVTVGYLLFRLADTFEDAELWPRKRRLLALSALGDYLRGASLLTADELVFAWSTPPPCTHPGYRAVVAEAPKLFAALDALPADRKAVIVSHALFTIEGMIQVLAEGGDDGSIELGDLHELRDYCYIVAGVVAEMLTELLLGSHPELAGAAAVLRENCARAGEGLQLVNILKDANDDRLSRRRYLPADVAVSDVIALARGDLDIAIACWRLLRDEGAPDGVLASLALPVVLAGDTLDVIAEHGPGHRLARADVMKRLFQLRRQLELGSDPWRDDPTRPS